LESFLGFSQLPVCLLAIDVAIYTTEEAKAMIVIAIAALLNGEVVGGGQNGCGVEQRGRLSGD
jgi:hypothetical protein